MRLIFLVILAFSTAYAMNGQFIKIQHVAAHHGKGGGDPVSEYLELKGHLQDSRYVVYTKFIGGPAKGTEHCTITKIIDEEYECTENAPGKTKAWRLHLLEGLPIDIRIKVVNNFFNGK